MFNFLKKKQIAGTETKRFAVKGMHCSSCATNIDLTLEDLPGVIEADTNFQKSELKVTFDPAKISPEAIKVEVAGLGYEARD